MSVKTEADDITIRTYKSGDDKAIAELMHRNFPDTFDVDAICKTSAWQFRNSFSKNSGVAIAEAEGKVAAHYAIMWLPMTYKREIIDGAISTASVTDMRFRRRGLFPKLAEKVYHDIRKEGCRLVFGFPNSQSNYSIFRKIGWFEVSNFPLHLMICNSIPFAGRIIGHNVFSAILGRVGNYLLHTADRLLNKGLSGAPYEIIKVREIDEKMDRIWETTHIAGNLAVVRNKKYLTWRYLEKPYFKYDIYKVVSKDGSVKGYYIVFVSERFGLKTVYVMEMLAGEDDKDVYCLMLNHLKKLAHEQKADAVSMLIMPGNAHYRIFMKSGFIRVPRKLFPQQIYFGARILSGELDNNYIKKENNWYISWGDLDVV